MKNLDFLIKNLDFLIKNLHFYVKSQATEAEDTQSENTFLNETMIFQSISIANHHLSQASSNPHRNL